MVVSVETILISAVGAVVVTALHVFVNDKVLLNLLPRHCVSVISELKARDKNFAGTCRANGTAFLHSSLISPIIFYCIFFDNGLKDRWEGSSSFLTVAGVIMLSYFFWDVLVCVKRFRIYGTTFFLHAVLTYAGLLQYFSNLGGGKGGWYIAVFMGTEFSTPLVHIRWMLIKGKATDSVYFQIVNLAFLAAYSSYRLFLIHYFCFFPYFAEILYFKIHTNMSQQIAIFQGVVCLLWSSLNIYWGVLLVDSQARHFLQKRQKAGERTKNE